MKKTVFLSVLSVFLGHISNCFADTVTSGNVGLLLPTTGVIDVNRSWADKFNSNWEIIASTLGTAIDRINSLATDTGTLRNDVDSLISDGIAEGVIFSTSIKSGTFVPVGFNSIRASNTFINDWDTTTLRTDLAATGVATGTLRTDLAATGVATGTLRTDLAATGVATGTLRTDLAEIGVDTGTLRTDLNNIVDAWPYTLIVGTRGAIGVHTTVENLTQWNLILSSVGLGGKTVHKSFDQTNNGVPASSISATIFFRNGIYDLAGSTWPYGLTAIFDSTAVIRFNGGTGGQLASVYGTMIDPKFDANEVAWTGKLVEISSFSRLIRPVFYGQINQAVSGGFLGSTLLMNRAVQARVEDAEFLYAKPVGGVDEYGDRAVLIVNASSDCYVSIKSWTGLPGNNTHTSVVIRGSTSTYLSGNWYKMGGNGIVVSNGSVDTKIDKFYYEQTRTGGDNAAIQIAPQAAFVADVGTGTFITNGTMVMTTAGGAGSMITIGGAVGGQKAHAVTVQNVHGVSKLIGNGNFITTNARSLNAVLIGVTSRGFSTGLTDTGIGTQKTGVYKDGVAE